jgi:hypothetical protein
MIRVNLRVERSSIGVTNENFSKRQTELESTPWMKYLRIHGKLEHVDYYRDAESWTEVWVLDFSLPSKEESFFRLKYGTDVENFSRTT